MNPETGYDIDAETLRRINGLETGSYIPNSSEEEAQLRELGFWRWVAFKGYAGKQPMEFWQHQKSLMLSCYNKTSWPIEKFLDGQIFELGCGPLGMIEFIPCRQKIAFDPLNNFYSLLYRNLRQSATIYISSPSDLNEVQPSDLGICFNVLDHTSDAAFWFNQFQLKIKSGGFFIFQVNTVRDDFPRTLAHAAMHPSSLHAEQVTALLESISDDFTYNVNPVPSADNEFFYMAFGTKRRA